MRDQFPYLLYSSLGNAPNFSENFLPHSFSHLHYLARWLLACLRMYIFIRMISQLAFIRFSFWQTVTQWCQLKFLSVGARVESAIVTPHARIWYYVQSTLKTIQWKTTECAIDTRPFCRKLLTNQNWPKQNRAVRVVTVSQSIEMQKNTLNFNCVQINQ